MLINRTFIHFIIIHTSIVFEVCPSADSYERKSRTAQSVILFSFPLQSRGGVEYLMLTPDRCLIFPSVDYVRNLVTKHSIRQGSPVVIDCSHIYGADFTAAKVIEILTQDFAKRHQPLFFYNLKPSVSSVFEGVEPKDFVVFYSEEDIDDLLRNNPYYKPKDGMYNV